MNSPNVRHTYQNKAELAHAAAEVELHRATVHQIRANIWLTIEALEKLREEWQGIPSNDRTETFRQQKSEIYDRIQSLHMQLESVERLIPSQQELGEKYGMSRSYVPNRFRQSRGVFDGWS